MIVSESITRVWQCDGLNCTADPVESLSNPFFRLTVNSSSLPFFPECVLDLCSVCIQTITAPALVAEINDSKNLP
jgi:hypothetical protein